MGEWGRWGARGGREGGGGAKGRWGVGSRLSIARAATSIIFVAANIILSRRTSLLLSPQTRVCRNKSKAEVLSRQKYYV